MRVLKLTPLSSGYSYKDGREVIAQSLSGGAARYRRDVLRATSTVSASFLLDEAGYYYLRAFYKSTTQSGSLPFTVKLLLDHPWLTEHTAHFVPNSIVLAAKEGRFYKVSVDFDVMPVAQTQNDADFVGIYEAFGSDFFGAVDVLQRVINVAWPGVL